MKAVLFEQFGQPPRVQNVPDPTPSAEGVVIKVEATGLCRSDWHGWMGHDPDVVLPHVPGHELAGTVLATGSQVTRWKKGDRVTVPFVGGCGIAMNAIPAISRSASSSFSRASPPGDPSRNMWRSIMPT